MKFYKYRNYISAVALILAFLMPLSAVAQEEANKKPTKILQDLLSEGGDFVPLDRSLISGLFIMERDSLKRLPSFEPEKLYEIVAEQVFKIIVLDEVSGGSRKILSTGSAVAINPNTLITNCHILGSQKIFVRLPTVAAKPRLLSLRLISGDRKTDRCMVQAEENAFKPVRGLRHSESLLPGEKVYSVGYPLIFDLAIAEGLISSVKKKGKRSIFLSTAVTSKGSSGGALFDRHGFLVGITTAVITQADHYSLAIPASDYFGN